MADKRFKAVASMKDRKAAFEDHCRNMSEQKKRVKASNGQAERLDSEVAKSNFRSLMEEASTRTSDGTLLPFICFYTATGKQCGCVCCMPSQYPQACLA